MKRSTFAGLAMAVALIVSGVAEAAPWAYITNYGDDTVSVLDTASNTVVAVVPVNSSPFGVAVDPTGRRAYITHDNGGGISVLDTATNAVVGFIGPGSHGVAITPDGARLYVPNYPAAYVSVVDTATNEEVSSVDVGDQPQGLAITPDGKYVYVANQGTGPSDVSVIDTATNTVIATVPVGEGPYGVAVTPNGLFVYVTNSFESYPGTVSVISTLSNTVVATIPVGEEPQAIAMHPDGTRAYVANTDWDLLDDQDTVSVIDTMSNTVIATVPVDTQPFGIAITPDGTRVYVATEGETVDGDANTVSVIDTASNTVVATLGRFASPYAFGQFIGPACPAIPFACNTTGVVPPDGSTLSCEKAATSATGVLVKQIAKCHATDARKERKGIDFDEDGCATAATDLLDTKIQDLSDCPACLDSTAVGAQMRQTLDQLNGVIYCAGDTPLASGDAGFVPSDAKTERCEHRVLMAAAALAKATIKCHKRQVDAAFNNRSFDESGCEAAAQTRYATTIAKPRLAALCPACLDQNARTALGQQVQAIVNGSNALTYCANCVDDTQCTAPQTCGGGGIGNICGGP
jgi:YVTN family beta-propeller protein